MSYENIKPQSIDNVLDALKERGYVVDSYVYKNEYVRGTNVFNEFWMSPATAAKNFRKSMIYQVQGTKGTVTVKGKNPKVTVHLKHVRGKK